MALEFTATEVGFENGLGGASNVPGEVDYHYVLFGHHEDELDPDASGVYFEFDDQIHGSVNGVKGIEIAPGHVEFRLAAGQAIVVKDGVGGGTWDEFVAGVRETFGDGSDSVAG